MSYILPFLLPPSPCPLVPPPPLDLKLLFYVDGLQTSSMVASAKIADNGRKWEDTTSYSDIIIRLYLALFPTSYELLYFLLVMVLPGTFQFDINFSLTGQ